MSLGLLRKTLIQAIRDKGQDILNSETFTKRRSVKKVSVKIRMKEFFQNKISDFHHIVTIALLKKNVFTFVTERFCQYLVYLYFLRFTEHFLTEKHHWLLLYVYIIFEGVRS